MLLPPSMTAWLPRQLSGVPGNLLFFATMLLVIVAVPSLLISPPTPIDPPLEKKVTVLLMMLAVPALKCARDRNAVKNRRHRPGTSCW